MAKPRGRSARIVSESTDDGVVTEFEGQRAVEDAIFSRIHDHRFFLPEQAPVCQGMMRGEFGYQVNTLDGRQVLSSN